MNRNSYDSDITTWSPQGRLHQIEYAMEAVKQGSAAVGLRSSTHAVLVALNRQSGDLASYQKKLIRIDNHMGVAIAGLTSDARVLSTYMRGEAMKSKMVFDRPLPVQRIAAALGDKAQINTQRYGRRPYGVGLLIAGFDEAGPHLFEVAPSGNFFDYYAISIGARSQSAKTYLERYYESFANASLDDLIVHGLRALRDTLQQDKELNASNCSVGFVGKDEKWTVIEGDSLQKFLDILNAEAPAPAAGSGDAADTAVGGDDVAPMETDS
ncbi:20S proteasome subunit alpha 6 [Chytriomyces sp. MP71]|nr:20S proteasome subunit alpha 6 [Chytriomyces sp. MP71]